MITADKLLELLSMPKPEQLKVAQALANSLDMALTPKAGSAGGKMPADTEIKRPVHEDFFIWTDGSCPANPGAGGWGAVVVPKDGEPVEHSGSEAESTNNRMELAAILHGLRAVPAGSKVVVYSDSKYAINCLTKWWRNWKKNGWRKKEGGSVSNVDLIEGALSETQRRKVVFEWVPGHKGHVLNERADRLAVFAALECQNREAGEVEVVIPVENVLADAPADDDIEVPF